MANQTFALLIRSKDADVAAQPGFSLRLSQAKPTKFSPNLAISKNDVQ